MVVEVLMARFWIEFDGADGVNIDPLFLNRLLKSSKRRS